MICIHCGQKQNEITVNTDYCIPYLAGYNKDGDVIYIDYRLPETFIDSKNQEVNLYKYMIIHETVEKALEEELGLDFNTAHSIAMAAQAHALTMDGVNYDDFYGEVQPYIIYDLKPEHIEAIPKDLDIKPYTSDHLVNVIKKMKELQNDSES